MPPLADKSDDRLSREAADWCIRMNAPDCGDEDRAAFRRWYEAERAHAAEYHAMEGIWRSAAEIPAHAPAIPAAPAWPGPTPAQRLPGQRPAGSGRRQWVRAAAVLLAIGLSWAAGWLADLLPGRVAYYAGSDGPRTITLPDQSRVELNRNSSLLYAAFRSSRKARLTGGEAYFEVAHDEEQPFIVQTETGTVEVTGTRFNVWTDPSQLLVTLPEGSVTVRVEGRDAVRLSPGQQASYRRDGRTLDVVPVDPASATAWRAGKLVLNDLPLDSALPMINRYLATPLRLGDSRLAGLRVGGIYDIAELHRLPDSLARLLPLRAQRGEREVVLLRR